MIRKKSTFQYLNIGSRDVFKCDCMHCMYLYLLSSYQSGVQTHKTQNPDLRVHRLWSASSWWSHCTNMDDHRYHDGYTGHGWCALYMVWMCTMWDKFLAWQIRGREGKSRRFRKMFLVIHWMSSVFKIFGIVRTSGFAMCFQKNWKPHCLLPNNLNHIVMTDHICWKAIFKSHKNHQVLFWKSENFDFFPCSTLAIICTRRFMKHKLRFLDAWMCYFWFGYPVRKGRLVFYGVADNESEKYWRQNYIWVLQEGRRRNCII